MTRIPAALERFESPDAAFGRLTLHPEPSLVDALDTFAPSLRIEARDTTKPSPAAPGAPGVSGVRRIFRFAADGNGRLEVLAPGGAPHSPIWFQVDKSRLGECADLFAGLQECPGMQSNELIPVHVPQATPEAMNLFLAAVHGQQLPVPLDQAFAVIELMLFIGAHGDVAEAVADRAREAVAAHLRAHPTDADALWDQAQRVDVDQELLAIILPYLDEERIRANLPTLYSAQYAMRVLCSLLAERSEIDVVVSHAISPQKISWFSTA